MTDSNLLRYFVINHLAVFPGAFHGLIAVGAEAFSMAVFPHGGEGGQQLDGAVVALQQHLGDSRRAAEVAVDLERRMGAEKVRVGACPVAAIGLDGGLQQVLQQPVGMVAIAETGPEADLPRP